MIHLYSEDEAHLNFQNSCAPVFVPILQNAHVLNQTFSFVTEISICNPSIVSHTETRLLVAFGVHLISLAFGLSASEVECKSVSFRSLLVVLLSEPPAISKSLNNFWEFWSFSYIFYRLLNCYPFPSAIYSSLVQESIVIPCSTNAVQWRNPNTRNNQSKCFTDYQWDADSFSPSGKINSGAFFSRMFAM